MNEITVSNDDIEAQLNHCHIAENDGRSAYPGMSFEQGVIAAIHWLTGNSDDPPVDPGDFFTED